jgi:hypothetical protein
VTLALSSRRLGGAAGRLAPLAAVATRLGFAGVFAAEAPRDAPSARAALAEAGIAVAAVEAGAGDDAAALAREAERATAAARDLGTRRVVVSAWPVAKDAPEAAREAQVGVLARTLHAVLLRHAGVALAIRPARVAADAGGLVGLREAEWLLSDLAGRGLGLWLDPLAAAALAAAGKGPPPLDWADRGGARVIGVSIAPPDGGGGLGRPEEGGVDWGTLRGSIPSRAARVLDAGPNAPDAEVVDLRRRFEEVLGW